MTTEERPMLKNPFKPGQRVQFTDEAMRAHVATRLGSRPQSKYGTVVRIRGPLGVVVRRDGYKTDGSYHVIFWRPLRGRGRR